MKNLPSIIPVFPLSGVLIFLNKPTIKHFEKRYLDLVKDTYKKDKLMGMVHISKQR